MRNIEKSNYKSIALLENRSEEDKYITKENIKIENWNHEYEAMNIYINGKYFKSRLAKKTPKKAGYFVAMWHKNEDNKNIPFQYEDFPEKLIVNIIDDRKKGQFIIPKDILRKKGILQTEVQKGKMAFRVYPKWEQKLNKSAVTTQNWQTEYFKDLSNSN